MPPSGGLPRAEGRQRAFVRGSVPRTSPRGSAGRLPASLSCEADLGVAHAVDGAGPDRVRTRGAVERDGLEVEQLAVRAAVGALRADGSALHPDRVDDGET